MLYKCTVVHRIYNILVSFCWLNGQLFNWVNVTLMILKIHIELLLQLTASKRQLIDNNNSIALFLFFVCFISSEKKLVFFSLEIEIKIYSTWHMAMPINNIHWDRERGRETPFVILKKSSYTVIVADVNWKRNLAIWIFLPNFVCLYL